MLKVFSIGLISTVSFALPVLADHHEHDAEIKSAMEAAPAEISAEATIMTHDDVVLRKGTNEWTCYPKSEKEPKAEGGGGGDDDDDGDAGCYNKAWMDFSNAFDSDENAVPSEGAMSYMISNEHPHTMVLMPGEGAVDGYPTERGNGTWAMGVGTSWQHLMIPYKK